MPMKKLLRLGPKLSGLMRSPAMRNSDPTIPSAIYLAKTKPMA
jgi:hypothetical protein